MFEYLEKRKKYLIYLPLITYWLTIFVATSLPAEALPETGVGDKIEHLVAYFILGVFISLLLLFQNKYMILKKYFLLSAFVLCLLYGSIDEIHQLFIPGRQCDIIDLTADTIGISAGIILIWILSKKFKYKPELSKV